MAPSKQPTSPFAVDERVFCFHMDMLYEARILEVQQGDGTGAPWQYKIHYKGWKNTWDDWVPQDRVRKFNDENRELATQLREQIKALQSKSSKGGAGSAGRKSAGAGGASGAASRVNGSDFSSARGSEERGPGAGISSTRGPRRARDYELENVSISSCPNLGVNCLSSLLLLLRVDVAVLLRLLVSTHGITGVLLAIRTSWNTTYGIYAAKPLSLGCCKSLQNDVIPVLLSVARLPIGS